MINRKFVAPTTKFRFQFGEEILQSPLLCQLPQHQTKLPNGSLFQKIKQKDIKRYQLNTMSTNWPHSKTNKRNVPKQSILISCK